MTTFIGLIKNIGFTDIIDILAVTALFYALFSLLRGTRSNVALRGMITVLLSVFLIYFLARVFALDSLVMIIDEIWIILLLVFTVVFQNEFRKGLTNLGQLRWFRGLFTQSGKHVGEIVKAVRVMSTRHIGALIAIERRNSLKPHAETGTPINSIVVSELLRTIFTPYSPLHDGAVVIVNDRIVSAACILPLTDRTDLSKDLGTRHRAAIGLAEETDALVIIVSEETGTISLAHNGQIERGLTPEDLRKRLEAELSITEEPAGEENIEASV